MIAANNQGRIIPIKNWLQGTSFSVSEVTDAKYFACLWCWIKLGTIMKIVKRSVATSIGSAMYFEKIKFPNRFVSSSCQAIAPAKPKQILKKSAKNVAKKRGSLK